MKRSGTSAFKSGSNEVAMKRAHVGIGVGVLVLGTLGACSSSVTGGGDTGGGGATSVEPSGSGGTPISDPSGGGPIQGTGGTTVIGTGGTSGDGGSINIGGNGPGGIEPPAAGPSSPGDGNGAVFAISKLFLGDTNRTGNPSYTAWKSYGYDIDHQVTDCSGNACQQITDHCKPAANGSKAFVYPDGVDGIDNSFGANILPILLGIESDESAAVNKAIANGDWTEIFDLGGLGSGSEYNPLTSLLYMGAPLGHVPLFDGTDAWPVRPESLSDPSNVTTSKEIFTGSYVVGNTWVSGVGQLALPLDGGDLKGFILDIQHAQITFEMSADHQEATNGTISGLILATVLADEFTQAAGSLDPSLCSGSTIDSVRKQIKQSADIMHDGSPGTSAQTCDAISIGLGFNAARVTLGAVGTATPPLQPCN
jgi:hypothetical protein